MALNTLKCNHLMPLHFKGLTHFRVVLGEELCMCIIQLLRVCFLNSAHLIV